MANKDCSNSLQELLDAIVKVRVFVPADQPKLFRTLLNLENKIQTLKNEFEEETA